MKILVPVKRVIDPYVKIRVKADGSGVETQNIKMTMNPFDEIGVEEAIRLKEAGVADEIVLVSIGDNACQETLRHGLALGADRGILVETKDALPPLNIAKILHKIVSQENPELVLMGKQSIDGDNNQTPQMLAGLLGWPQVTYASVIKMESEQLLVTREIDGGLETLSVNLPAVVSTDLRLNEPRYASLPNIMKAKRKPLDIMQIADLGIDLKKHTQQLIVESPSTRTAGVMLQSVEELVEKLKNEAKVL
ncbi:electron transfer flavoprotein subunit beta/FixA family protein [Legionella sp. W05-934-2]|uniref:electron transfer flavoprotein subunit beta/FixA family protein n=1 Tax=Legionella sp. W05-934-2 TaxID=1198649 RepID=UPI0034636578